MIETSLAEEFCSSVVDSSWVRVRDTCWTQEEQGDYLGEGSYGFVYKYNPPEHWKDPDPTVSKAAKVIIVQDTRKHDNEHVRRSLMSELFVQKEMAKHNLAIPIYDHFFCDKNSVLVIIMKQVSGNLEQNEHLLTIQHVDELWEQIDNMHNLGILHRDLKTANVFFNFHPKTKKIQELYIGDFGFAIVFDGTVPEKWSLIDYIYFSNSFRRSDIREHLFKRIEKKFGRGQFLEAWEHYKSHDDTCWSEFVLLEDIPHYYYELFANAVSAFFAWRWNCEDVTQKQVTKKLMKIVSSFNKQVLVSNQ